MSTTRVARIDVYPVGLLGDLLRVGRMLRADCGRRSAGPLRYGIRYLVRCLRGRRWRDARNYLNGYLAEPAPFPGPLRRCGSGWTRARALRSLHRCAARDGLAIEGSVYPRGMR